MKKKKGKERKFRRAASHFKVLSVVYGGSASANWKALPYISNFGHEQPQAKKVEREVIWTRVKARSSHDIASSRHTRIFRDRHQIALSTMATTVQTLPKFLLPRLSWSAPVGKPVVRALIAAAQTNSQRPWQASTPARTIHTERAASRVVPGNIFKKNSSPLQQPALRRAFHASAPRRRDHHFDTLKFVQRLKEEGFTEEQSTAMMKVLNDVIQERFASTLSLASTAK